MLTNDIDPQNYTQLPRLDVASATALTTSLVSAMSPTMPGHVKAAAESMIAAKDGLLESWRNEPTPTVNDRRPADQALDRAWGACHARVKAFAALPADEFPQAERAAELLRQIFPDGLTFLTLAYNQEWAESEKRLQMIEAEELNVEIDEIAGGQFLKQVKRAHAVYGEVLGITKANAETQSPVRAKSLRNLRKAMSRYVFSVLSHVSEEESTNAARAALRPIDELRASLQSRRSASSQDTEVNEIPEESAPTSVEVELEPGPVAATASTSASADAAPAPVEVAAPAPVEVAAPAPVASAAPASVASAPASTPGCD